MISADVDKENKGLYNYFSFFGVSNMHIYLPEIKSKTGEFVEYQFDINLGEYFDDFSDSGNLKLMVSASYSGEEVIIRGNIEASITAVCSRCLEPFSQDLKTDFTEVFTVIKDLTAEDNPEYLAEKVANMLTISGDFFYLDEYVRQLLVLTQEYSPLCKPGCKGICSGCGADLNRSSCSCPDDHDENIDIRLLKLKELISGN